MVKEKMISYEEKSVGSTRIFKCEACPHMALAEDDIKFHLFTAHPELAKSNGIADNIQIPCPGCTSVFDAEETLRTHLRNHHMMGIKDIKKMVRMLVQIALKNIAKLKKEKKVEDLQPVRQEEDLKMQVMPQVIEITPDNVNANSNLPEGVTYITVEELNKLSPSYFEKKDPKEIIQEACLNIVYASDGPRNRYISVSETGTSVTQCNVIQVSVPPDLISSIPPHATAVKDTKLCSPQAKEIDYSPMHHNPPHILKPEELNQEVSIQNIKAKKGITCSINGCIINLKEEKNIAYHRKCHQNKKLVCPECARICTSVELMHTHLWKTHSVDLELPTCPECGYKTYKLYRLYNIHMKCHREAKDHICPICSKAFKNVSQLSKHKVIHKKEAGPSICSICSREFNNARRLKVHIAAVHDKLKPFKCSHCEYSAARKEELKLHLRSHTGDKPYSCSECSYRCSDHNAIRRHKKTHSKERLYKCKYCPYTTIQSTVFTAHVISKHPKPANSDVHRCPYCPFKSVSKDKYVLHLSTHTDTEAMQMLVDMNNSKKPSWTIPSEAEKATEPSPANEESEKDAPKPVNEIPIEVYDCDSLSESMPQNYSKSFCATPAMDAEQTDYDNQATNLSKDSTSDCLLTESSTMDCRQFPQQLPLMTYDNTQSNLHEFLNTAVPMEQNLNSNVNSLASNHCPIASGISNNIMSNFPIRLPLAPRFSTRNHIMLKPVDKIHLSMNKVSGPIITPTQILVPSSSNSPVNQCIDDGAPRKKPKISVKSNLILKGPDQENRFHSQQNMAFRRLEDNQRFGLGSPVTFNNLISTKFMHLPPESSLSESPDSMMPYPQETMLEEAATTPVDSEMTQNPQIFTFNQQMNVNTMTMLPPPDKIQTNDPSYIKLEAIIKQNTQSPSLERMCTENLMSTNISREYKASPPLEDINKNMSEIKNELKSDFYMPLSNTDTNPSNRLTIIDQFLMDNIMGEQYSGHLDLPGVVLQETPEAQNEEVIEIDDNSGDNKLLPRYDMNMPFESLCLMHNDFYYLDNEMQVNNVESVGDMSRMVTEVPLVTQKEDLEVPVDPSCDFPNFIQGKEDPMMNTSVRLTTNKINVKNIELMKK